MKKTRIVIFLCLSVLMLVLAVLGASAASYTSDAIAADGGMVARVGDEGGDGYYPSLSEAIAAANADDTVTLIADATLTGSTEITEALTLDGGAKRLEISGLSDYAFVLTAGEFTVRNVSITVNEGAGAFHVAGAATLNVNAVVETSGVGIRVEHACTVNVTGGMVSSTGMGIDLIAHSYGAGTVNLLGGGIVSVAHAVYAQGTTATSYTLNIDGAHLESTGNHAVYFLKTVPEINFKSGTVVGASRGFNLTATSAYVFNMSGGSITANGFGIWMNGGTPTLNITGGSVTGTKQVVGASVSATVNIKNATVTATQGSAIFFEKNPSTVVIGEGAVICQTESAIDLMMDVRVNSLLKITGGEFVPNTSVNPARATSLLVCRTGADLVVTGGKFFSGSAKEDAIRIQDGGEAFIYGGYFEGEVPAFLSAQSGATVNVYGGYFNQKGTQSVLSAGTASSTTEDIINVYGGSFAAVRNCYYVFFAANDLGAQINLYAYNAQGAQNVCYDGFSLTTYPDEKSAYSYNAVTVQSGASIRTVPGSAGLRFVSTVPAGLISMLTSRGATDISYGTLILPTDYISALGVASPEVMRAQGYTLLDIPAVNGVTHGTDGSVTLRAAMVSIHSANYARSFSGVAYVKYTLNDETVYYYSAHCSAENARSISQVADEALDAYQDGFDAEHRYQIEVDEEIKFSRYSADQRNVIAAFTLALEAVAAVYDEQGAPLGEFFNLSQALNAAPAHGTVKLLGDLAPTAVAVINRNPVTLDGDGYTLTFATEDGALRCIDTNMTVKNLALHKPEAGGPAVQMEQGALLVWESGEVVGDKGFELLAGAKLSFLSGSVSTQDVCVDVAGLGAGTKLLGGSFASNADYAVRNAQATREGVFLALDACSFNTAFARVYTPVRNEELHQLIAEAVALGASDATVESEIMMNECTHTMFLEKRVVAAEFTISGTMKVPQVSVDANGNAVWNNTGITFTDPAYKLVQGGTTDGNYYYMALISNDDRASIYPDHYSFSIAKYSMEEADSVSAGSTIAPVSYSAPRDLDHANDITYLPHTDELLVVHNAPNRKLVSFYDAHSDSDAAPEYKRTVNIGFEIYGMHYVPEREQFVAACSGGESIAVLDKDLNLLYKVYTVETGFTTQGIAADEEHIYLMHHAKAGLMIYDWQGNFQGYVQGDPIMNSTGYEVENVSYFDGRFYVVANQSYSGNDLFYVELIPYGE